jgi:haloalkane dehalogenase
MNSNESRSEEKTENPLQLVTLIRAILANRKFGRSPGRDANWVLQDSPVRPDCVEEDRDVPILTTESGLSFVRTPDEHFESLPGYSFQPRYVSIEGMRMHYVDEGPPDGPVVLLLHGQPSWSYLYRKMIPFLVCSGLRTIAVDHIGMGRSDKPIALGFHTFETHVQRLKAFIAALDLHDIVLFCQDWGGLMGLRVVGEEPALFARVIAANTTLPVIPRGLNPFRVPNPVEIDCSLGDFVMPGSSGNPAPYPVLFQKWILYALTAPNFRSSQVIAANTVRPLSPEELAAYDAPYPSFIYKAAVRAFPAMVAAIERHNTPAWKSLGRYEKPFLFFGGEHDLNLGSRAVQKRLTRHIPGAAGQPHERFEAHHFIQEDVGEVLAQRIVEWMKA